MRPLGKARRVRILPNTSVKSHAVQGDATPVERSRTCTTPLTCLHVSGRLAFTEDLTSDRTACETERRVRY